MKATLTFNLPDDEESLNNAVQADSMLYALFHIKYNLKKAIKQFPIERSDADNEVIDEIFGIIYAEIEHLNI